MSPPVAVALEPVVADVSVADDEEFSPLEWYENMIETIEDEWREHMILHFRSLHYTDDTKEFRKKMEDIWSDYMDEHTRSCPCGVTRMINDSATILNWMYRDIGNLDELTIANIVDVFNCWLMTTIHVISYDEYQNYRQQDETRYNTITEETEETKNEL